MSTSYSLHTVAKFFGGRVITIIAGSDDQIYHVHVAALATSESPSLRALVSEKWDPSSNKAINWNHTDSDTAERFFTYLYTGDYHIPDPDPLPNETSSSQHASTRSSSTPSETSVEQGLAEIAPTNVVQEVADDFPQAPTVDETAPVEEEINVEPGPGSPEEPSDTDLNVQRALLESFERRPLTPLSQCIEPEADTIESPGTLRKFASADFPHANHSYKRPMLALAHLYCFALYHLCPSLQTSTLRRLTDILLQSDCSQPHAALELIELIQFVYDNTPSDSVDIDPMRKIVSQFTAINYTSLMCDSFEEFYTQGGDFALDIARLVRRRLLVGEQSEQREQDMQQEIDSLNERLEKTKLKLKAAKAKRVL